MTEPETPARDDRPTAVRRVGRAVGGAAASAAIGGRAAIREHPVANTAYRAGIGVIGGATVALGVVLIPLPGPGALISLGGLGILATEFEGAKKVQGRAAVAAKKAFAAGKSAAKKVSERRRPRSAAPEDSGA